MHDLEMKQKVAQEIMDLMDQKDGDRLKAKSPKVIAASVEIEKKPSLEVVSEESEDEKPEGLFEKKEEAGEEELDSETIKKLLEMMNGK